MVQPRESEEMQTKEGLICPIRGLDFDGQPTGSFIQGNDLAGAAFWEDPSGCSIERTKVAPGGRWKSPL